VGVELVAASENSPLPSNISKRLSSSRAKIQGQHLRQHLETIDDQQPTEAITWMDRVLLWTLEIVYFIIVVLELSLVMLTQLQRV